MVLSSEDFVSPVDLIATTTAFFGGEIDLDPASSEHANKVVQATRYFNWRNNGLNQSWKAKNLYLFPPRESLLKSEQPKPITLFKKNLQFKKSAQCVWLELCHHKWLRREFDQAIVLITSTDVALLSTQRIGIDVPLCILKQKPKLLYDREDLKPLKNNRVYGFVFYFPPVSDVDLSIRSFHEMYSNLGRVYVQ
jgi:hypothetical protein